MMDFIKFIYKLLYYYIPNIPILEHLLFIIIIIIIPSSFKVHIFWALSYSSFILLWFYYVQILFDEKNIYIDFSVKV